MFCVLCQHNKFRLVFEREMLKIVQCISCGLVCQTNIGQAVAAYGPYDNLEAFYKSRKASRLEGKTDLQAFSRTSDIRAEIKQHASPGANVLDIGCGMGEFLTILSAEGYQVAGVEPSIKRAKLISEKLNAPIAAAMYHVDLFPAQSFDVATFLQVLEHVDHPVNTLRIAHQHLKPGGLLVVDVPSYNNPRILLYRLTQRDKFVRRDFIHTHTYYYTPKTLAAIVQKAGFHVMKVVTGNYRAKHAQKWPALRRGLTLIDYVANLLRVGGITLYATR